jgi:hypothetical protein
MTKKEIAAEVMKSLGVDQVWVTSDKQAFTNEHSAHNHEKEVLNKRSLLDEELPEKFTSETTEAPKKKATDLIEEINNAETVEEVNALAEGDSRATVVKAAAERVSALSLKKSGSEDKPSEEAKSEESES